VLAASRSSKSPAVIQELWKPKELAVARKLDEVQYKLGLPNPLDVVPAGLGL
jgi:hypothetical protein